MTEPDTIEIVARLNSVPGRTGSVALATETMPWSRRSRSRADTVVAGQILTATLERGGTRYFGLAATAGRKEIGGVDDEWMIVTTLRPAETRAEIIAVLRSMLARVERDSEHLALLAASDCRDEDARQEAVARRANLLAEIRLMIEGLPV